MVTTAHSRALISLISNAGFDHHLICPGAELTGQFSLRPLINKDETEEIQNSHPMLA